ncbi:hypothetical protein [Sorangium sp. So ce406]|uniref:hypothetical protein n=1 Tax=Sorangium sp. So ce406 TaxID=3133311 RepID=UPI003F5BEF52
MQRFHHFTVAALMMLSASSVACDESANGCEDAKTDIENTIKSICDEPAYAGTPFCSCCVAEELYSVDDECRCQALNFDVDACYYSRGDQAKPQAREAVEYANSICKGRLSVGDAGSAQCSFIGTGSSATSSAEASSSAAASGGGGGNGGGGGSGGAGGDGT